MSSNSPLKSRPRWNDTPVREAAVPVILPRLVAWCEDQGIVPQKGEEKLFERDLRATLALAITECSEPYAAARYMEDVAHLPADTALVQLMEGAFREIHHQEELAIARWVMETGTRFKAKTGDMLRFRVGDLTLTGTVEGTKNSHALGLVSITRGDRIDHLWVPAEDVLENLGAKPKAPRPTPPKTRA